MIDTRLIAPEDPGAEVKPSHAVLKTGIYIGASLIIVMFGALVAANRFPGLEPYALERNAVSYSLFVILMLVPVCRFLTQPGRMFAAAMLGWVMFAAAYDLAGLFFRDLFQVLRTPLEALVEGAIVYGTFATILWVAGMVLHARHHPIAPRRKTSEGAARHVR
jgi:hypothetical protein